MTLLNIQPNRQGQHQLMARTSPGNITEHRLRRIHSKGPLGAPLDEGRRGAELMHRQAEATVAERGAWPGI